MDRQVIAQAVEMFLDPEIRRYPEAMIANWLDLRLCLTADAVQYQRKKDQILAEINTPDKLKTAVREFVISSQADILLAMAFRANLEAKQDRGSWIDMAYRHKCFLLNVLVLLFQERRCLIFVEAESRDETPGLEIQVNAQNRLNLDLRFFVGYTFLVDDGLRLRKFDELGSRRRYIGFHLPRIQLIDEAAEIVKTGLGPT